MKLTLPLIVRNKNTPQAAAQQTAQSWLPLADLVDGIMLTKDKRLVAVVRVHAAPFSLLSEAEQERRISGLRAAYQALAEFQVLSVARPVDLDGYLKTLDERQTELSGIKRRLLREYAQWVAGIVRAGEAMERRYYVLLSQPDGKAAREELVKRARALARDLAQAELEAHVCDTSEVADLLFVSLQPRYAALERVESEAMTTLYEGGTRP